MPARSWDRKNSAAIDGMAGEAEGADKASGPRADKVSDPKVERASGPRAREARADRVLVAATGADLTLAADRDHPTAAVWRRGRWHREKLCTKGPFAS